MKALENDGGALGTRRLAAAWLAVLANRRSLMVDLERALGPGQRESFLALYDLDGFKAYNDSFGHPAGDDLLQRLGRQLATMVEPNGRAYRLGGDQFCVLAPTAELRPEAVARAAEAALSQQGSGFSIGACWGLVRLPTEASTPTEALRVADRRMYAQKGLRAGSALSQTRGVLLRVLHEREPELNRHLEGVAHLAAAMGHELGLDSERLDVLVRAGELHDIGKVAIPDEILHKAGPLTDQEWELMRKHTVIGERVLAAAPAMQEVAFFAIASPNWLICVWIGDSPPLSMRPNPKGGFDDLHADGLRARRAGAAPAGDPHPGEARAGARDRRVRRPDPARLAADGGDGRGDERVQ